MQTPLKKMIGDSDKCAATRDTGYCEDGPYGCFLNANFFWPSVASFMEGHQGLRPVQLHLGNPEPVFSPEGALYDSKGKARFGPPRWCLVRFKKARCKCAIGFGWP